MCVLNAHWVGGGRLDTVPALQEPTHAYQWHMHELGFGQLLLSGGCARNLTITSFHLNQISVSSVSLKLSNKSLLADLQN